MGERALKFMVVLLSTINAAIWFYYTQSTMMGIAWAACAAGFLIWIADDIRRR
jgi:membrane protein YdbS with pleckstrin-like domain